MGIWLYFFLILKFLKDMLSNLKDEHLMQKFLKGRQKILLIMIFGLKIRLSNHIVENWLKHSYKSFPAGHYRIVVDHSGLALELGICIHNGTIDSDYRGVVCVILFNFSNEEYIVKKGYRNAQLIIRRSYTPKFVAYTDYEFAKEENTERRSSGFGSTGGS